jgi:hypothetical protein
MNILKILIILNLFIDNRLNYLRKLSVIPQLPSKKNIKHNLMYDF